MSDELRVLTITAASIGCIHTLLGPDHYLPFIMMAAAKKWSLAKTAWVTALCGLGHIAGSLCLGLIGFSIGIALKQLDMVESFRGQLAAWLLISFGLAYLAWGIRSAVKNKPHTHWHSHRDGIVHSHPHTHHGEHAHLHEVPARSPGQNPKHSSVGITPWALFLIFVLGPCELLIPVLLVPALQNSVLGLCWVVGVFAATTIVTMVSVVLVSVYGIGFLPLSRMQRYTHVLAGAAIALCGVTIQFFGL